MSIVVELSIARLAYGSADRSESLIRWTIQPHFRAHWNPLFCTPLRGKAMPRKNMRDKLTWTISLAHLVTVLEQVRAFV